MQHRFLHLQYVVVFAAIILGRSSARELRPSEHGLDHQGGNSPPPENNGSGKQMLSFFGAGGPSAQMQLPEARNVSDTWRNDGEGSGSRDLGKDHVRVGLLVASAVCGVIGVALLAVSGAVYIRRLRKQEVTKNGRMASTSAPASVRRQHYSSG